MRRIALVVAVVFCTSHCSSLPAPNPPAAPQTSIASSEQALVQRVVDGDTFIALVNGRRFRVRLIGVNTPETVKPRSPVECYGPESSAFAKATLTGKTVRLVYDVDRYDRYGRTLAYVYLGKIFFNLLLVQRGFAVVETVPPDVADVTQFVAAQRAARTAHLGLWRACIRA